MKKLLLLTACAFFLSYGFALAGKYSKTETRTYNITSNGKVSVQNVNGEITVESWDKDQVSLEITKTVRADDQDDADEYFGKVRVEVESGKDYIDVTTHYPHDMDGGFFDWLFHGGSRSPNVDYRLRVPVGASVDLESTNGQIYVENVEGNVQAHSTNGGLNLNGVSGRIEASTTNGGISVTVSNADKFDGMDVSTTNGGIKVYCPEDIDADVDAHTTNGGIDSEFPITVSGSFLSKSLSGRINNGGKRMYLHTTNGGIEIDKK